MNAFAASAALLMAFGGLVLAAAGAFEWRRRRVLADRVDWAIGVPPPVAPGLGRLQWPWLTRFDAQLRRFLAFGVAGGADVEISTAVLLLIGLSAAFLVWLLSRRLLHLAVWAAELPAMGALILVPRWVIVRQRRHMQSQFLELFPDSVDMVVRMIRAGLPVTAAIRAVGEQGVPPVSTAFSRIADEVAIGIALEDALAGAAVRVGVPDFRFFAVAVALQRATGGNLAVTLETLGEIIRKRRAVRLKAKAATAEVRASAYVLGSVPFFITGTLRLFSPAFLDPLLTDKRGNVIGGIAVLCLVLAALTMRWLIRRSASS